MTQAGPLVLLIEDEPQMRRFLRSALPAHEYRLVETATMHDGLAQAAARNPDLILLDLGLPDGDGLDATRRIREWSAVPIIVLSARELENDKIAALDAGADDYLTKPFSVGELLARMRVALRHAARATQPAQATFRAGTLAVDLVRRLVTVAGEETHLSPTEYKLLTTLIRHAGMVCTQRLLVREVWGNHVVDDTQNLRVVVAQLRRKIEADTARPRLLQTEPGVGYRLRDDVEPG
ncbi:MAG: response regulator [Gemmatimonadaceae bacterium]|nr:response regulator [Gemmatimonadaceae bacterium]